MSASRIVAIAAAGALAVGGAGAAIAAVSRDDPKKSEDAVLADAAKRLNVTPEKLRDALKAAQDAQLDKRLDEAVKNGDLTRKQADAIKDRREESGLVLGPVGPGFDVRPGPGFRGRFGPGPGKPHSHRGSGIGLFAHLAKALGISERELFARMRKGDSIAAIAKAEGKSLAAVRSSVKASAKARLDRAVKDRDLTRKQADRLLEHLDEHLEQLDRVPFKPRLERHRGPIPVPPGVRPGDFEPGGAVPALPPDVVVR